MPEVDKRLERIIEGSLEGADVRPQARTLDGSLLVLVDAGQGPIMLRVQWAGAGWPRDVRESLARIDMDQGWPRDLILVARQFSSGARDLLKEAGANWADETGAARIVAPGLLVSKEGTAAPAPRSGLTWSRSETELAELLLSKAWLLGFGTTEIANQSNWSIPRVSRVLQTFDEQGWTGKYGPGRGRGAKRELVDPDGMLESWAAAVGGQEVRSREASRTIRDPVAFLGEELAPALSHVRWALGGWAAAQEVAPFVTTVPTLQIHVHEDDFRAPLDEAIRLSELREADEGGRVQFLAASPSLLSRTWSLKSELPLASTPRIYADLCGLGPRGREAAEHLKEEAIDPLHRRAAEEEGPSEGLVVWERETKARLRDRMRTSTVADIEERYRHGTYSATYLLRGVESPPSLPQFKAMLEEAVGYETGWPAWRVPQQSRSYENAIEAWFEDNIFNDPSHSDFWRADPRGRLCLIRGYQEDSGEAGVRPGSVIDLTLPVWRVGEYLLHAGRLATRLGATRVEFMMRWEGLEGRMLTSYVDPEWPLRGEYRCHQDEVVTSLETTPAGIEPELPRLVERLVAPLFAAFDSFEAPEGLYERELEEMRARPVR
ncbi:MAG TPA: type IV toxin-antitoxin system AbiEi family antitoxin [Solirubrobacterales bacterium]|nr:type IV toxin-antitoxin system AbiEi family antitoxin [Solirubrobacterales bacterium]